MAEFRLSMQYGGFQSITENLATEGKRGENVMKKSIYWMAFCTLISLSGVSWSAASYGKNYCGDERFTCHKVKSGETWEKLFPHLDQRDLVMRLNRINIQLRSGMVIAIPKHIEKIGIIDIAPFEEKIQSTGERKVLVDLNKLAWGAYDEKGHLIHWGPASGGKEYCPDVGERCRTVAGNFKVQRKQPAQCVSSKFPIEWDGGAPMPYCMHFFEGYALHGSYEVPGYNASHGCVRLFINDARWLNEQFVKVGTKVTVVPYE